MAWILYDNALQLAGAARKVSDQLKPHDANLAGQLRRAAASVPLNLAEGSARTGGDQRQHYLIAYGSAREVLAALQVAAAMGYGEFPEAIALADCTCRLAWGATR